MIDLAPLLAMPFAPGFRHHRAAAKVLSFLNSAVSGSAGTTFNFASSSFGAEAADRRIIVALSWESSGTPGDLASATIGGVAATIIDQQVISATKGTAIIIAHVPTGTSGTISLTWGGTIARVGIGWWRATGLSSNTEHAKVKNLAADPLPLTLASTLPGGFAIATVGGGSTPTSAWTNATERYEQLVDGDLVHSGADAATVGGSFAISDNLSVDDDARGVAACW